MNVASKQSHGLLTCHRKISKHYDGQLEDLQVQLQFVFQKKVEFGRGLYLVGNIKEFGEWDPTFSVKLFWSEGDNWTQTVNIDIHPIDSTVLEYKIIETDYSRIDKTSLFWENGPNRVLELCPQRSCETSPAIKQTDNSDNDDGKLLTIDCQSLSFKRLAKRLRTNSKDDFVLLKNIDQGLLKEVIPIMKYHMIYYPEDCTLKVCPIFYRQDKWKLMRARTFVHNQAHIGSWAFFRGQRTTKLVLNHQSNDTQVKIFSDWIEKEKSSGEIPQTNSMLPSQQGSLVFNWNSLPSISAGNCVEYCQFNLQPNTAA